MASKERSHREPHQFDNMLICYVVDKLISDWINCMELNEHKMLCRWWRYKETQRKNRRMRTIKRNWGGDWSERKSERGTMRKVFVAHSSPVGTALAGNTKGVREPSTIGFGKVVYRQAERQRDTEFGSKNKQAFVTCTDEMAKPEKNAGQKNSNGSMASAATGNKLVLKHFCGNKRTCCNCK